MVTFSAEQILLLQDRSFLLEKKNLSAQIISLLAAVEADLKLIVSQSDFHFPKGTLTKAGKISRGENYQDLPYFVLDYPRLFKRESAYAYRVMIWWGHEISFTLHLQGEVLNAYRNTLISDVKQMQHYYLCVGKTPWEYHFEADNYIHLANMSDHQIDDLLSRDFVKISAKAPLSELENMNQIAQDHLLSYLRLLNIRTPQSPSSL